VDSETERLDEVTNEEARKIVWDILGQFEKAKGQIRQQFLDKEVEFEKQKIDSIAGAMKELGGAIAKVAVAVREIRNRMDELEKLLISKLDDKGGGDAQ
jgi:hypothetical protein